MSVRQAFVAAGVPAGIAAAEAPRAEAAMVERGITTQHEAEAFLAEVLHESVRLQFFEEIASGAAYEGRRDLGNTQPGDGKRYKGRGPIQLTGRANYRAAGRALGLALESHPTLAARHDIGWRIAAWYWQVHGLDRFADGSLGGLDRISLAINGGTNGQASRRALWRTCRRFDCRPVDPWAGFTASEVRWIREYDALKRSGKNIARRRVLRAAMKRQRKQVWRAAQPPGSWDHANRRRRYAALKARSD